VNRHHRHRVMMSRHRMSGKIRYLKSSFHVMMSCYMNFCLMSPFQMNSYVMMNYARMSPLFLLKNLNFHDCMFYRKTPHH
jgi:hypothetical protein